MTASTTQSDPYAPRARWLRIAGVSVAWALVALFFAFGALLLAVRYIAMPRVDELRPRVEQIASRALKARVTIGRIEASWHRFNPHLTLHDVRVADRDGERGLSLPNVEGTVSWLTVIALEPRFSLLRIDKPELDIERLPDDRFSIAGLIMDPNADADGAGLSDWILEQQEVVIRDARLRYYDRRRPDASTIELTQVNLQLENLFGSHTLGLQAVPPPDLAAPLDVRARFKHRAFDAPSNYRRWSGELFGQVDFADLAAVARIVDQPFDAKRAHGAVRGWLTFDQARITRVTVDIALTGVDVTLGDELEPLQLTSLQGRVSQRRWGDDGAGGQEFEAQRLTFVTARGRTIAPFDVKVRTTRAVDKAPARTQVQASRIDLRELAWFATHVPIAREVRVAIDRHALSGMLHDVTASWEGSTVEVSTLGLKARFEGLASAAQPARASERSQEKSEQHSPGLPGFENLSGNIDIANGNGSVQLASADAVVIFPGVFADPRIRLAKLNASAQWKLQPQLEVHVTSASASNADIEVAASGSYRAAPRASNGEHDGPGSLDLTGRISRLNAPAAYRYVPIVAGAKTIEWLQHALIVGRASDGLVRIRGDLRHFPFHQNKDGEMRVTARVADATLDVYPAKVRGGEHASHTWPQLSAIDAELLFDRASMTITAQRAAAYGARISNTVVRIPELTRNPTLDVQGTATGPLAEMLRYVNTSPVANWIGGFTAQAQASGDAKLDLRLTIPLQQAAATKVAGALTFANNDITLADVPPFSRVAGTLHFTENSVRAESLTTSTLGGQARIDASTRAEGGIQLTAVGIATVPGLRRAITIGPVQQLLDRSQGQARYSATLTIGQAPQLKIESDLVGVAINLIAPLAKTANEAMPLRIERIVDARTTGAQERDELLVNAGRALAIRFERRRDKGEYRVVRGVIALNEPANLPESGVLVMANVPRLDLEAWSTLFGGDLEPSKTASQSSGVQIDLLAVRTAELVLMGRIFRNVTLGASRATDGGYNINAVSEDVSGYVGWRPERITARLSRLSIPTARKNEVVDALRSSPKQLPALDIVAEQFELGEWNLGRLDLVAQNIGAASSPAWNIRRFDITNPDMKLTASGEWTPDVNAAARRTKVNFKLDARDAGATLDRFGFKGTMAAGRGSLEGDIEWIGAPLDIDYPTLSGKLALSLDDGRFLQVDAGNAARLLSLLSLQSLSRTLFFDGGRQFADGFAYNTIRADATIAKGVISTNNFRMTGASAAALMSGTIDLRSETQQLHLVVLPEIDASTAALAIGVLNPVLGIGAFLAQYVLRNPLSKVFALEYDIGGTWTKPTIARRGRSADNTEQNR